MTSAENLSLLENQFNDLVIAWNRKINLVSRKKTDVYDLIEDSKVFLDYIDFRPGMKILDLGTGGGFPGILIAIHHPEVKLTAIDSIKKKVRAVEDIVSRLGLRNIDVVCSRAEELCKQDTYKKAFHYIVARSVAKLYDLTSWSRGLVKSGGKLITLKGGDVSDEVIHTKNQEFVKEVEFIDKNDITIIVVKFI